MKYLIVNTDDFGMCHSVNSAVVRSFREGILTQTTLMAPCPWFEEAVALAKEFDIPCGVHLVATCDWDRYRWRPLTDVRSFVESDGVFSGSIEHVQKHAGRGELEAEFIAQIELVLSRGIQPTDLDCHMALMDPHVHAKLCRKYGLLMPHGQLTNIGTLHPEAVFPFDSVTSSFSADADPANKKKDFCNWLRGLTDGYHMTTFHVGQASPELEAMASRSHHAYQWAQPYRIADLAVVLDPEVMQIIKDLGIKLISLRDHPSAKGRTR